MIEILVASGNVNIFIQATNKIRPWTLSWARHYAGSRAERIAWSCSRSWTRALARSWRF
jgi:hypothetical protein